MRARLRVAVTMLVLSLLVLTTALAVAWSKHETRKRFAELHALQVHGDALEMEWGRLLLEQGTWSTHGRIERVAGERIDMHQPAFGAVQMIVH